MLVGPEAPPLVLLVARALVQVRDAVTRTFTSASASKIRVSRVDFSGPAHRCVRILVQGVRGEMRPVSCGFELAPLEVARSRRHYIRMHRACVCSALLKVIGATQHRAWGG